MSDVYKLGVEEVMMIYHPEKFTQSEWGKKYVRMRAGILRYSDISDEEGQEFWNRHKDMIIRDCSKNFEDYELCLLNL